MSDERPQINASRIAFGAGVAGAIFTLGSMLIFLTGLPMLWYMFPAAIILGCVIALILRFARRETPGSRSTLFVPEPSHREKEDRPRTTTDFSGIAPRVAGTT